MNSPLPIKMHEPEFMDAYAIVAKGCPCMAANQDSTKGRDAGSDLHA